MLDYSLSVSTLFSVKCTWWHAPLIMNTHINGKLFHMLRTATSRLFYVIQAAVQRITWMVKARRVTALTTQCLWYMITQINKYIYRTTHKRKKGEGADKAFNPPNQTGSWCEKTAISFSGKRIDGQAYNVYFDIFLASWSEFVVHVIL